MGGRGSNFEGGGGSGTSVNVVSEQDIWSYRHNPNNAPYVDAINTGVSRIQNDFPDIMQDVNYVNTAELGGKDRDGVLGYYTPATKSVALNQNFTDIQKMNRTYDASVQSGFHPSRGNRTGTEAVALHEMGHALTDHVAKKLGITNFDAAARTIVTNARKSSSTRARGNKQFRRQISGYAARNDAEGIAEAVADYYCNGNRASSASKAIMNELFNYR